jgi:hypothetical protein
LSVFRVGSEDEAEAVEVFIPGVGKIERSEFRFRMGQPLRAAFSVFWGSVSNA